MTANVVIVGGGVVGCAVAFRLAQAGARVTVLERAIPGAEASSAAAGILAAQEESEAPGPFSELALASRARFPALVAELGELTGLDVGYRGTGLLSVAFDDPGRHELEGRYAWQRDAGLRVEWLDGAAARAREPALSERIAGAFFFPDEAQLEPRAYLRALSLAAARAGARFVTGAYVRRVVHEHGRVAGVETDEGLHPAEWAVVAAGSWSALVEGAALPPRAVRPLRGQIVQVETRPPAIHGVIVGPGGYLLGRADGRIILGSTMERAGFDKRVTAGGLAHVLQVALALAPGLAAAPVTDTWANFRPMTEDGLPILGPGPVEGLLLATGHFRNGILLSAITGEIIRDLVVDGRSPLDLKPFALSRLV